jgi:hypothetical protein
MKIAIAVKKGKFQIQRVTYAENGKATIAPQSCWLPTLKAAQSGKSSLEQYDARKRITTRPQPNR